MLTQILSALHTDLIAPVLPYIKMATQLTIVPYSDLHYLPLHLLYHDGHYLIEDYELVILPAAGLMTRQTPIRPPGALVLAHSSNGQFPEVTQEAEIIGGLMEAHVCTEDEARRNVLREAPRQILHIAAHGSQRMDHPELSFVELADGRLYTHDLLQSDLSYELVVFSGCETGRSHVAPGDELVGLGRGILYAGAGAFIASLWRVEDTITANLMQSLYQKLLSGLPKSTALRQAQLELKDTHPDLHPVYWGAFQMIGNPDPLSTITELSKAHIS